MFLACRLKQQCPNDLCRMTKEGRTSRTNKNGQEKDDDILHYKGFLLIDCAFSLLENMMGSDLTENDMPFVYADIWIWIH